MRRARDRFIARLHVFFFFKNSQLGMVGLCYGYCNKLYGWWIHLSILNVIGHVTVRLQVSDYDQLSSYNSTESSRKMRQFMY